MRTTILITSFFLTLSIPSFAQSAQTCDTSIVAWWTFNDSSSSSVEDFIKNHDGNFVSSTHYSPGKIGAAAKFTESNYISVPDDDMWAWGYRNFSIEFWASFNNPGGSLMHPGDMFICHSNGPGETDKWWFAHGDGKLSFHVNHTSPYWYVQTPFSPNLNQWYHLGVTRSGDTLRVYIDGQLSGTQVVPGLFIYNSTTSLTIGEGEGIGYMDGKIDEMTIYQRALSSADMEAIYNLDAGNKCKNSGNNACTPPSIVSLVDTTIHIFGETHYWDRYALSRFQISGSPVPQLTIYGDGFDSQYSDYVIFPFPEARSFHYAAIASNACGSDTANFTITIICDGIIRVHCPSNDTVFTDNGTNTYTLESRYTDPNGSSRPYGEDDGPFPSAEGIFLKGATHADSFTSNTKLNIGTNRVTLKAIHFDAEQFLFRSSFEDSIFIANDFSDPTWDSSLWAHYYKELSKFIYRYGDSCFFFITVLPSCGAAMPTTANVITQDTVKLLTQTDLDDFYNHSNDEKWTKVNGVLIVDGSHPSDPVTELCNLSELTEINGHLFIQNFNRSVNPDNLDMLARLKRISCKLSIRDCPELTEIELDSLEKVGCTMVLVNNRNAHTIDLPQFKEFTGENILVKNNPRLRSLSFSSKAPYFRMKPSIGSIEINTNGDSATGPLAMNLHKVVTIPTRLIFTNNDNSGVENFDSIFTNLDSILGKNLSSKAYRLTLTENDYLNTCCKAISAKMNGKRKIENNYGNCETENAAKNACTMQKRSAPKQQDELANYAAEQTLQVYPNPGNGQFIMEIAGMPEGTIELELHDLTGRLLYREKINNPQYIQLNFSYFESGQYILAIKRLQGKEVRRLTILK